MHRMKHYHYWFVMYVMLKPGEGIVARNVARSFTLYVESPGKEKMKDVDNKLLVILASNKPKYKLILNLVLI